MEEGGGGRKSRVEEKGRKREGWRFTGEGLACLTWECAETELCGEGLAGPGGGGEGLHC